MTRQKISVHMLTWSFDKDERQECKGLHSRSYCKRARNHQELRQSKIWLTTWFAKSWSSIGQQVILPSSSLPGKSHQTLKYRCWICSIKSFISCLISLIPQFVCFTSVAFCYILFVALLSHYSTWGSPPRDSFGNARDLFFNQMSKLIWLFLFLFPIPQVSER